MKNLLCYFKQFLHARNRKPRFESLFIAKIALDQKKAFTEEDLFYCVQEFPVIINRKWVYQTMLTMVEAGLLEPIFWEDGRIYLFQSICSTRSDGFRAWCANCHRSISLPPSEVEIVTSRLIRTGRLRYVLKRNVEVQGLCRRCYETLNQALPLPNTYSSIANPGKIDTVKLN